MEKLSFLNPSFKTGFIKITEEQLEDLKKSSSIICEENTFISDFVRIFEINNLYIFQEKTPEDEILLRKFKSIKNAKELIQNRLNIYEKMWNGCGCRIDYYSTGNIDTN